MTKQQLFDVLTTNGIALFTYNGVEYILHSIERESGSGNTFNVRCTHVKANYTANLFIRIVD